MSRRQSVADQSKRVEKLCCPVHGLDMYQVPSGLEAPSFTLAACTRADCGRTAVVDCVKHDHGSVELRVRQLITGEQLDRLHAIESAILTKAAKESRQAIDAELREMASELAVQLPIEI